MRHWAFNFIQILSELAKERPDLLCLVVSVRDNTTEAYRQIHRDGPVLVEFKGETARDDRKRLLLHRLFENRDHFSEADIEEAVRVYADERCRLLFGDQSQDHPRLRREVADCWPFAPELRTLLEDRILMAAAAQDKRDMIRILAEVFRARGESVPVITAADFHVDDDACGVTSLLDSFATTADQEQLRVKAQRNLEAIRVAGIDAPHTHEIISGLWMRSMGESQELGGTRNEVQLDITREAPIDDNAFTVELATIVDNSFNIHPAGTQQKRYCFKLPENPAPSSRRRAKQDTQPFRAWARRGVWRVCERSDRLHLPELSAGSGGRHVMDSCKAPAARRIGASTVFIAAMRRSIKGEIGETKALEPVPARTTGTRRHARHAAHRAVEPTTETNHGIESSVGVDRQPLENRLHVVRNRAALVRTNLPPRPIEQRQVVVKGEWQKTTVRGTRRRACRRHVAGRSLRVAIRHGT